MAVQVFVNDQFCPIADMEEGSIVITRELADIAQPDSRSGDYVKRFPLACTPETAKLFNHLFEANIDIENTSTTNFNPDFNPNLKASATVLEGNTPAFKGDLRLDDIEMVRENKIVFWVEIYAKVRNFFNDLGESTLEDLDLSALNHNWSSSVIISSWTNTSADGYVYPMIDYGTTTDQKIWAVKDFRPAVFFKYVWDLIFDGISWAYSSAFLDTTDFTNLILVGNGAVPPRTQSDIDDDTFAVAYTGGTQTLAVVGPTTPPSSIVGIFDWDTATGTVSSNALQNTSLSEFNLSTNAYQPQENKGPMMFRCYFEAAVKYLGTPTTTVDEVVDVTYVITVSGPARGTTKVLDSFTVTYNLPSGTATNGLTPTVETVHTTVEHVIFNDDRVQLRVFTALSDQWTPSSGTPPSRFNVVISDSPVFANIPRQELFEGETMSFTNFLPKEMKQRDFILAGLRMFNLYVDQVEDRTLLIEPRDGGYYLEGDDNVLNWTDKLAIDQPYHLRPMGFLDTRKYTFSFTEGKDYMSQRYKFQFNENYGDKFYNVQNDFQVSETEIKLPFATGVLANNANQNDRILTNIQFFDDTGQATDPSEELRVLYYGGAVDTNNTWYFRGAYGAPLKGAPITQYPYAGHLNDPNNPTRDYLFSYPRAVYYDIESGQTQSTKYTSANLFNRFYSKFIFEITDKNSRVFEGYFYIDLTTWTEIDFRKLYFIKDAYYRLLKVRDHNIDGKSLTLCRFLKTDFTQARQTEQKTIGGDGDWSYEEDPLPLIYRPKYRDLINSRTGLARNDGYSNVLQAGKGIVKGDVNVVGASAEGFHGFNVSGVNVYAPGVFMANCEDMQVGYPGLAYINNTNLEKKLTFTLEAARIQTLDTDPYELLPAPESTQYWDVTRVDVFYDHNGTNYSGGGALEVQTITSNVDLLDDAAASILNEGADKYEKLAHIAGVDLNGRMGEGVQLITTATISGAGGPLRFSVYYRLVDV